MTRGRMRVGVLFGGRSGEHEVSLASARSVLAALDRAKYDVVPIGITPEGVWLLVGGPEQLGEGTGARIGIVPGETGRPLVQLDAAGETGRWLRESLDVVFPVLHGTYGEDGTIQGLLELLGVPYVGPGVMASAVGMDKVAMKVAFQQAGLAVVAHRVLLRPTWREQHTRTMRALEAELGYPMFVKPSNLGSSVGVSKVVDRAALPDAIEEAFQYDRKILVERGLDCREVECGILGNDNPEASVVGEIVPKGGWYDYQAKYVAGMSEVHIPASLPPVLAEEVRAQAIRAYQAIDCAGMGRVDFFLDRLSQHIYVNEINTIPGFTATSVYPKLWEATGLSYSALVDRLIQLGLDRHRERQQFRTTLHQAGGV